MISGILKPRKIYENMNAGLDLDKQNTLFSIYGLLLNSLEVLTDQSQYSFLQGVCPGLSHGQKFGISYAEEKNEASKGKYTDHPQSQSHSVIIISNPAATHHINTDESDSSNIIQGNKEEPGTLLTVTDEKSVEASSREQMHRAEDAS